MADIQDVELLVISSWESRDGKKKKKTRLVQWVIDGVSKSVKLERRTFFKPEGDEDFKMGKAEGFGLKDLEACKPHWSKIIGSMRSPPPVGAAAEEEKDLDGVDF